MVKKRAGQELTQTEQVANLIYRWRHDFPAFFEEGLNCKLSNQQRELVELTQEMVWAKIRGGQGKKLTKRQRELEKKVGISVHSGKGLGKDYIAAGLIICIMYLFNPFKGMATAGNSRQLEDVLSNEVRSILKQAIPLISNSFIVDKKEICRVSEENPKKKDPTRAVMAKRTANVTASTGDNADALQGFHRKYMLFVIDEASGVPDAIIKPMETTLTDPCNFILMIGNVVRANGYFYQSHYGKHDRKLWECVRWNAEESDLELIKPGLKAQIERIKTKYGTDSNAYRMNVLGLPPAEEEDALIPWIWILAAQDRWADMEVDVETDPTYLGVDVGGGVDDSAITLQVGSKVIWTKTKSTRDTTVLADWLNEEIEIHEPDLVVIDSNGLGQSFCNFFRKHYYHDITELNVGTGAANNQEYFRLRDEIWFKVREQFEKGRIAIPPKDEELALELSSLKVDSWDNPKKVLSKKKMKAKGLKSPNRADSLMHNFLYGGTSAADRKKAARDRYNRPPEQEVDNLSWMMQ